MRILHYFLGFHRQGGLNRYASDLAVAQAEAGDEVFVLYPSGSLLSQKEAKIRRKGKTLGVRCFVLTGGRSISLLEGICNPERIMSSLYNLSEKEIVRFWKDVRPEILHIHTWMGFPEELLPVAKQNGCKIIYTTHDYFGLCPMVNRLKEDGSICKHSSDEECSICNRHAPSERYLEFRNSETLLRLKTLVMPLKKMVSRSNDNQSVEHKPLKIKPFAALKQHYCDLFRQCDKLHFNSPVTRAIFNTVLPEISREEIAITHAGIIDRRTGKIEIHQPLHLAFFGSSKPYKGLPMLLEKLGDLAREGVTQWQLNIYGCEGKDTESIHYHGTFHRHEEWKILAETDLLIVPSICDETFGFVVEEALCCGVPVIASDKVGAKMLLNPEWSFSGADGLRKSLRSVLMNPSLLQKEKKHLQQQKCFVTMAEHEKDIKRMYFSVLKCNLCF